MDIFNQVRVSKVDYAGRASAAEVSDVEKLIIRINHGNGYVFLAESADDTVEEWFQFSGYALGPVDVDENGITFDAVGGEDDFQGRYRVVVTRKGIYG